MKCPFCKKKIHKKAAYCPECGRKIEHKGKKNSVLWFGLLLILGVIGGVAGYIIASQKGLFSSGAQMLQAENGDYIYHPAEDSIVLDEETFAVFYEDLLIVYLKEDMSLQEREELAKSIGGKLVGNMSGCMNIIEILVDSSGYSELEEKAEELMENASVLYASTEIPLSMESSTTVGQYSDPWKTEDVEVIDQNNNADESNPSGNDWWAEAIQAYSAWNYVDNHKEELADVKVGIIDLGVDSHHEDFLKEGKTKITPLNDYQYNVPTDHGTHVTGIIGAQNNNVGIRGIADQAELYCVDYSAPVGEAKTDMDEPESIYSSGEYIEVTKQLLDKEICVINNSWTTSAEYKMDRQEFLEAIEDAYYDDLKRNKGFRYFWEYAMSSKEHNMEKLKRYDEKEKLYEDYQKLVEVTAKRESFQLMYMMAELFQNGKNDFLIIESAGNGYHNAQLGYASELAGKYCAITEKNYNELDKNKALTNLGYSYETFKEHIIIVGAVRQDSQGYRLTDFSNYGSTVDMVAPGADVYSTVTTKDDGIDDDSNNLLDGLSYGELDGTSMAAPMVAGSAALLWSVDRDLSAGKVKELLISTANTAVKSSKEDTRQEYPMLNVGEAVKKAVSDKKGATSVKYEVFQEDVEYNGYFTIGEYAVVKGYDDFDQEVWTFRSDTIPMGELMTVYEIGIHGGNYYIAVGGVVYVFRVSDGKELWTFDQCESVVSHAFDEKDNLFVCGYYGPDFCEISPTGELIKKIDYFYDDYYWPFELHYNGTKNTVDVLMEGTPTGEVETITVNLEDYTYAIAGADSSQNPEEIKMAKKQLLSRMFDLHQKDERAPAYAAIDLSGDGIDEIIIRTFTSQATEGGRYIYEVYHYAAKSKSYSCSSEKIYSFAYDALLYDESTNRVVVNWTFADEYDFVIYAYSDFGFMVADEVYEDLSDLPAVVFADITAADKMPKASSLMFSNIFDSFPQVFVHTSGAGSWQTEITVAEDGTFTGEYSDVNGDEVYICNFTGKFSDLQKIDEYTYSMQIESLDYLTTIGDEYYEGEYLYIGTEPVGFEEKGQCMLYLPGRSTADLPEEFLDWVWIAGDISEKLPFYGIYNIETSSGFFSDTP